MNVEEIKSELKKLFGQQIIFNQEFEYYVKNLDVNLIVWCQKVKDEEIKPAFPDDFPDELVFIKKIGSSNRCLIIKIKNGEFKEVHLGDHDYYNKLTKVLGLKKSSYTY